MLFYCGTTWADTTWAFHIIIFIVTRSKKFPESSLDQQVAQAAGGIVLKPCTNLITEVIPGKKACNIQLA